MESQHARAAPATAVKRLTAKEQIVIDRDSRRRPRTPRALSVFDLPCRPGQRRLKNDVVNGDRPVLPALLGLGVVAALLVAVASPGAQAGSFVDDLLRREMRFSAADLRTLDAGSAVIRSLETPVRQELAHFGVVYVDAPTERFVDRFGDIERFESGPGILQI